jgi:hypothetical protein
MGSSDSPVTPKLVGFALFWMGTHLHRGSWDRRQHRGLWDGRQQS